jgi:hypothetical protein
VAEVDGTVVRDDADGACAVVVTEVVIVVDRLEEVVVAGDRMTATPRAEAPATQVTIPTIHTSRAWRQGRGPSPSGPLEDGSSGAIAATSPRESVMGRLSEPRWST